MRRHVRLFLLVFAAGLQPACEREPTTGFPGFASPHAQSIALAPSGAELYVTNTAADTLDVIDTATRQVVRRVKVGIDPVSVAVRPDGSEVWVANHVSDSVSVVDVAPGSPTRYRVVGTVQAFDPEGQVSAFDEPVGIAFASDAKAYVALSSRNHVAVVDVASRTVTNQILIRAQEPRAMVVRGGRLFVLPFESNNQTEISGCFFPETEGNGCTFSVFELISNGRDAILTRNLVADIIRNPLVPDRDLFVFDTADESPIAEISGIGTLLYGLAIDSQGDVFIAQTEARNDDNGLTGTAGHDLIDLDNRAFLNQIARVDCSSDCGTIELHELEPLPPANPAPGMALATPFGIQISDDDTTLVSVAAGSSVLFTLDAATGQVLGRVSVGAIPRGLALRSAPDGSPDVAWVFNAVGASVSRVDVSDPTAPVELDRIALDDPTHPEVRAGRIAFNDANGSTTRTFSCASCHPDGNTDQLLWNLGARCLTPGCDQVQPRTTMPIRGLRDTLPLHWDGVPGDPFGGINAEVADSGLTVEPNCTDEHSCFRNLVDGAMSGTMCDQAGCPENGEGLLGAFGEAERDAMAVFLRSVPYPPARSRRMDDRLSDGASEGFWNFMVGAFPDKPGCSRVGACHSMPFWAGTNTPGTGFDAPTFRGLTDRFLLLPNGRSAMYVAQAQVLNDVVWDRDDGPDELYAWGLTFGTEAIPQANRSSSGTGPLPLFRFFEEGSTGFSGAVGRQVTLDAETLAGPDAARVLAQLARLEQADADGLLVLDGHASRLGAKRPQVALAFEGGSYEHGAPSPWWPTPLSREELVARAAAGELTATLTARLGAHSELFENPQPGIWLPHSGFAGLAALPQVSDPPTLAVFARHLVPETVVVVDGRAVEASVECDLGGSFPACTADAVRIDLAAKPTPGNHVFQLATPGGMLSNEIIIQVD